MATQQEIDQLISQALIDDDFRSRLLNDPEATAASVGITLDRKQVAHIRKIDRKQADLAATEFQSNTLDTKIQPSGFW